MIVAVKRRGYCCTKAVVVRTSLLRRRDNVPFGGRSADVELLSVLSSSSLFFSRVLFLFHPVAFLNLPPPLSSIISGFYFYFFFFCFSSVLFHSFLAFSQVFFIIIFFFVFSSSFSSYSPNPFYLSSSSFLYFVIWLVLTKLSSLSFLFVFSLFSPSHPFLLLFFL